jgi:DNA repair photolyase
MLTNKMKDDFNEKRTGTGTREWAEVNENISRGCSNGCLYCYAAHNASRFKLRDRADWETEELTKKAFVTSYPLKKGVIMFPTAHDITPSNIDAYLRVIKLMLDKGNQLLIVSKPRLDCIKRLVDELKPYQAQIMFRFTIGSMDDDVTAFWEPVPVARRTCGGVKARLRC